MARGGDGKGVLSSRGGIALPHTVRSAAALAHHVPLALPCLPVSCCPALQDQSGIAKANQVAIEAVSAIKVVGAYSLQEHVSAMYAQVGCCCWLLPALSSSALLASFSVRLCAAPTAALLPFLPAPTHPCTEPGLQDRQPRGPHDRPRLWLLPAHPLPLLLPRLLVWRHPGACSWGPGAPAVARFSVTRHSLTCCSAVPCRTRG